MHARARAHLYLARQPVTAVRNSNSQGVVTGSARQQRHGGGACACAWQVRDLIPWLLLTVLLWGRSCCSCCRGRGYLVLMRAQQLLLLALA